MKITLAVQSPQQVGGACKTAAHYVRIGYPYCSQVAKNIWPVDKLSESVSTILAVGKIPQLFLPFCPLEKSEEKYWQQNKELLAEIPQTEVIISNWGTLNLSLYNPKIASTHLNVLCSEEVDLLREHQIRVVALPLSLRSPGRIRRLVANNPGLEFEYQLDGQPLTGFNWFCQAEPGSRPAENGGCCQRPRIFTSLANNSSPDMHVRGNTVWLGQRMSTLQQVQELAEWGVKRGVINWGDYDLNTVQELIALYIMVLNNGVEVIKNHDFYAQLRDNIRIHDFN